MASGSCVLIGEGNILLSSLNELLTFDAQVKAVFSNTEHVRQWCAQRDIPAHPRGASLQTHLHGVRFDFLFSINNPRVLKEADLGLARRLSVNYHDSLLPAYAGVNASSWALINGETRHGVTLHAMEAGIDTGRVLESQAVPILPADSALALNLRCVEAFRSAFTRLLRKLFDDSSSSSALSQQVQDTSSRSYYGLYACPPNMGLLDFECEFQAVHNLARALEYGHQENPLGSPKILTASARYLLVTNAERTQRRTYGDSAETRPGTILDIVDDTLIVKTATDPILLSLAELNGSPIHARKFKPYALTCGSLLQSPRGPPAHLMSDLRKKETFWRRQMQRYEPSMFLRQKLNIVSDVIDVSETVNIKELTLNILTQDEEVPGAAEAKEEDNAYLLLTSFVSFMARICCTSQVSIGLMADKSDLPPEYRDLYADVCPGVFDMDLSLTSKAAFLGCFDALEKYKSARTFLIDTQYRYPELGERLREMRHNMVVATPQDLLLGEEEGGAESVVVQRVLSDCNMLLVLSLRDVKVYYKEKPNYEFKHILDTLQHFPGYLTSLFALSPGDSLLEISLLSAEEQATLYPLPGPELLLSQQQQQHQQQQQPEEGESDDLYALFQKQCQKSPQATALRTTSHEMTYGEAEKLVSQLALLMEQELPETSLTSRRCVGLHLPNSTAYVMSVLASLALRCPFLPLPADLPVDRLTFTLRDAKVTTMVTTDVIFNSDKFESLRAQSTVLFTYGAPDTTLMLLEFEVDDRKNVSDEINTTTGPPEVYSNGDSHSPQPEEQHKDKDEASLDENHNVADKLNTSTTNGPSEVYSNGNTPSLQREDKAEEDDDEAGLKHDCCYVMYTSGSTGKPKGVQVRTPNVVNLAEAQIQAWDLGPGDVTAQFASIGFDACISEIMTALLSGGTLAVLQEQERLGEEFVEALEHLEVSVITLPPSVLNTYGPRHLPTLRKIVTAGEACMSHTAFKWTEHDPSIRFFNAYGPTETTVCATIYEFRREDYTELANQDLAIGSAVKGAYVYLLDDFMKPVPPEVVGEIYIGGAGVSAGYIGHAAHKNATSFIPNPLMEQRVVDSGSQKTPTCISDAVSKTNGMKVPHEKVQFSSEDLIIDTSTTTNKEQNGKTLTNGFHNNGKRSVRTRPLEPQHLLYRTGDHAFQDEQGRLTFVGRLDDQVKIRGQRVDLGEIEQVILQHPKVEMAVVVKHKCSSCKEPSIAAFIAPTFVFASELREYLSRALPRYMIPTFIRRLKVRDLPTSINGKVNRRALETDESVHHEGGNNVGSSHLNEAQLAMAKLWCRVLQLDEPHAYSLHRLSSFSQLGGNSLHLVIMQRLIEDTFHVRLSFIDVGAADTIESFTDIIKRKKDMLKDHDDDAAEENEKKNAEKLRKTILEDSTLDLASLMISDEKEDNVSGKEPQENVSQGRSRSPVLGKSLAPIKILISGVTGFLGAFLLHELLEKTESLVMCMVREKNEAKGMGRVVENLQRYGLWRQSFFPRLAIVLSDVSEPRLGIAPNIYHALCVDIDVIFINAAKMNFNTGYDDHRQANVLGTKEFLRLALKGRKKFLFLTSSLSVFLFPPASPASPRQGLEEGLQKDSDDGTNHQEKPVAVLNGVKNGLTLDEGPNSSLSEKENSPLGKPFTSNKSGASMKRTAFVNGHISTKESDAVQKKSAFVNGHISTKTSDAVQEKSAVVNGHTFQKESDDVQKTPKHEMKPNPTEEEEEKEEEAQQHPLMKESDFLSDPLLIEGGYGQSKWASERLVLQALDHLPGGAIFRPARVSGRSSDGAGPHNDLFASSLMGMKRMGSVPDLEFPFDLTPVDFCATAMVEIMEQSLQSGGVAVKKTSSSSSSSQNRGERGQDRGDGLRRMGGSLDENNVQLLNQRNNVQRNAATTPMLSPQNGGERGGQHRGDGLRKMGGSLDEKNVQLLNQRNSNNAQLSNNTAATTPMPRVFHLFNKNTLAFKDLFRDTDLPVLPLAEWRQKLRRVEDNPLLLPLTPFFLSAFWDRALHWPVFDTLNTDRYVSQDTQRLMPPSEDLLKVYERYFQQLQNER